MILPLLDASVLICAYTEERWSDVVAAVASVQRQTVQPREIILVVDHNPALYKRAQVHLHGVTVLQNTGQRGLSGARNSGVAAARGAIVAFLDDDAVAAPDWLACLSAAYAEPTVLGVGGAIAPAWPGRRPAWFPEEFDWVVGCTYRGLPRTTAPVRNLIGCNMSLRREVFEHVGGFRADIGRTATRPLGCEETELCIRAGQYWPRGRLLFEPRAVVWHRVPAARASWRYFRARCYHDGLSKARVARTVGQKRALSSEASYVLRVLPLGIARGLGQMLRGRGAVGGLGQVLAICAGLALTILGYLAGKAGDRLLALRGDTTRASIEPVATLATLATLAPAPRDDAAMPGVAALPAPRDDMADIAALGTS